MKRERIRDCLVYLAAGVGFLAAVFWVAGHDEWPADAIGKWGGLVLGTAFVLGVTIREHRASRRRASFWTVVTAWLVLHTGVFVPLLLSVREWKIAWWVVVIPAEYVLVAMILSHEERRPDLSSELRSAKNHAKRQDRSE